MTRRPSEWMESAIIHARIAETSNDELGWGEDKPSTVAWVDRNIQLSLMYSSLVLAQEVVK